MSGHSHLRVRFYPSQGEWTCVVQRLDADGMPQEPEVISAKGATKDAALDAAIADTADTSVQSALRDYHT
jgi:hypothetical protein